MLTDKEVIAKLKNDLKDEKIKSSILINKIIAIDKKIWGIAQVTGHVPLERLTKDQIIKLNVGDFENFLQKKRIVNNNPRS